jgi:hypothetical protein
VCKVEDRAEEDGWSGSIYGMVKGVQRQRGELYSLMCAVGTTGGMIGIRPLNIPR